MELPVVARQPGCGTIARTQTSREARMILNENETVLNNTVLSIYFMISHLSECLKGLFLRLCVYLCEGVCGRQRWCRIPRAGITGSHELPDMRCGN